MDTQTLQIIADTFQKVSDDAVVGISIYLGLEFLKVLVASVVPWAFGAYIIKAILGVLSKLRIEKKETK